MPKIVIEVERPTETSPGAIAEGHYNLIDGKVCGPSGSGKSTLIKCVNGLEPF